MKPCWRHFHRTERKLLHWSVGHDAPRPPLCVVASPGPPSPALAGRGVYAPRALLGFCLGITSERLGGFPPESDVTYLEPRFERSGLSFTLVYWRVPNQAASAALVSWPRCPLRRR